jgi:hypothetical protein
VQQRRGRRIQKASDGGRPIYSELGGGALLCTLRGGLGGGGLAALFEALVEGAPACRWALCTSSLAEVVEAATQGALS